MPELFDPKILSFLEAESENLASGEEQLDEPIRRSSNLMSFVEQAFAQSFRRRLGLEVMSFTQADKDEILVSAREADVGPPQKRLIDLYVDVCNVWPDVLSQSYGGSTADFLEFRTETVPELLAALESLSEEPPGGVLAEQISAATRTYTAALVKAQEAARDRKSDA